MQNNILDKYKATPQGTEASSILQACVHCGFCTATCPTYQETGDERDGPRGRIYLMKQYLEGEAQGRQSRVHLDRCLTCRSCETTCPSGVEYGHLVDLGRQVVPPPFFKTHRKFLSVDRNNMDVTRSSKGSRDKAAYQSHHLEFHQLCAPSEKRKSSHKS